MLQNQTLSAIISSLRAFDLFSDTLDILIISFVFYQLIQFARKSRAGQLVKGIALLILFYGFAVLLDLRTVTWVLNNVVTVAFTAAVVIFQPELRRALERMGQTTVWANRLFGNRRTDPSLRGVWQSAVVAICDAAEQLSDTRTGALMVLERRNNLDEIIRKVNGLFEGELSDNDQLVYVNGVLKGKLLENATLVQQAATNSKEQFANSPDLADALMNAIMDAFEAHTTMSSQALGSERVREGLKDTLLGPAQLYEALRARGQMAASRPVGS